MCWGLGSEHGRAGSVDTPGPSLIPGSFCPGWGWPCDLQRDCLLSLKFISFFIKSLPGRLTALIYGHGLCQTGRSDGAVNISVVMCLAAFGVPSSTPPTPPLPPPPPSALPQANSTGAGWSLADHPNSPFIVPMGKLRPRELRSPTRIRANPEPRMSPGPSLSSSGSEYLARLSYLLTPCLHPSDHCLLQPDPHLRWPGDERRWEGEANNKGVWRTFQLPTAASGRPRKPASTSRGQKPCWASFPGEGASLSLPERREGFALEPQALWSPDIKLILPEPLFSAEHLMRWTRSCSCPQ